MFSTNRFSSKKSRIAWLLAAACWLSAPASFSLADPPAAGSTPQKCPICGQFHLTGPQIVQQTDQKFDDEIKSQESSIDAAAEKLLGKDWDKKQLDPAALDTLKNLGPNLGVNPADLDALTKAVAGGDTAAIDDAMKKIGPQIDAALKADPTKTPFLVPFLQGVEDAKSIGRSKDVLAAKKDLDDKLKSGATEKDVQAAIDAYKDKLNKAADAVAKSPQDPNVLDFKKSIDSSLDRISEANHLKTTVDDVLKNLDPGHLGLPVGGGLGGVGIGGVGALPMIGGVPVAPGTPIPDATPEAASAAGEAATTSSILIVNPAATRGEVTFTFEEKEYSLRAGAVQEIPGVASGLIVFDRGGSIGEARYTLSEGAYEFSVSPEKGWDVRQKTFNATLDNSGSSQDFHFLAEGKNSMVAARKKLDLSSKRPIVIVFDRGDGGQPAAKTLEEGVYKVGVDPKTRLLDIYSPSKTVVAKPPANSFGSPASPSARTSTSLHD